jgi:drug/metabolite transporter (DMT)-like permease
MSLPPLRPIDAPGAALALLLSILWGANPVAIKVGLEDAPPIRLAWMRFLVGGIVIVAWGGATGRLRGIRIARGEWRPLLVLGLLFAAQIASMNVGTALTSAAHSAVLLNLYAVHTVVLAHFLIPGDRLTLRSATGVAVAYSGIVFLFKHQASAGAPTLVGDVIMFVSSLILAERTIYLARVVRQMDHVKLLLAQAVIGTALFLLTSLLLERAPTHWTPRLAGSIAYQGVVIAGFNFVVNLWLLERYRPSILATFFLTQPIFGVIAAALVTGDPLTTDLFVASAAVAVGIALTIRRASPGTRVS